MNTSIDAETVTYIASLARLVLTEQEVALFSRQLSEVIDYNMSRLSELDTSGVEPLSHPGGLVSRWREDVIVASLPADEALSNAPQENDGYFAVPKVLNS